MCGWIRRNETKQKKETMKSAQQWQEELNGETSIESIKAIQADALTEAVTLVTAPGNSHLRIYNALFDLLQTVQPTNQNDEL